MKPVTKTTIAALAALIGAANPGFAGNERTGNGGGAWTCRVNNELRSATLVDLFEGRQEFGLSITAPTDVSTEALIDAAERKIFSANKDYYDAFAAHLAEVRSRIRFVSDVELVEVEDSLYRSRPAPETCPGGKIAYEQLANYTHDGMLLVDKRLWDSGQLTTLDQAALYVHEAAYSLQRQQESATDSRKARKLVGYLFSDQPVESYSHLMQLPKKPKPAEPTPGTYEYQKKHIAGDWYFSAYGEAFVVRIVWDGEYKAKVYACNVHAYFNDNKCVAQWLHMYAYDPSKDAFLGPNGEYAFSVSGSDPRVIHREIRKNGFLWEGKKLR